MTDKLVSLVKPAELIQEFQQLGYVAGEELATIVFLSVKLRKPLLLEGNPGVGKTELAQILSRWMDTSLIRLQCYEGLDVSSAVYEWNYQKQLLAIKIQENSDKSEAEKTKEIFGEEYLMRRPLLEAISQEELPPVLLIDEIDRADEEFEAYLLELLSAYQISIPEFGTVHAKQKPLVILTSNRTRELGDALKRRCLYYWIPYPSVEKELEILRQHLPDMGEKLSRQLVQVVQQLRGRSLEKIPGVAETLDWARGLLALGYHELTQESVETTLGCVLKSARDIAETKGAAVLEMLESQ